MYIHTCMSMYIWTVQIGTWRYVSWFVFLYRFVWNRRLFYFLQVRFSVGEWVQFCTACIHEETSHMHRKWERNPRRHRRPRFGLKRFKSSSWQLDWKFGQWRTETGVELRTESQYRTKKRKKKSQVSGLRWASSDSVEKMILWFSNVHRGQVHVNW